MAEEEEPAPANRATIADQLPKAENAWYVQPVRLLDAGNVYGMITSIRSAMLTDRAQVLKQPEDMYPKSITATADFNGRVLHAAFSTAQLIEPFICAMILACPHSSMDRASAF